MAARSIIMIPTALLLILFFFLISSAAAAAAPAHAGAPAHAARHQLLASLLAFKASITHDPHNILASWNATLQPDFCSWPGLLCSPLHHLRVQLNLPNASLAGSISPSLCPLPSLTSLNLSGNYLSGTIPSQLASCPSLQLLDLTYNAFLGPIPFQIGLLRGLRTLLLSHNSLSGSIPHSLTNCTKVQFIDLSSNNLNGIIPLEVGMLSSLHQLDLSFNGLSGPIPEALANCSHLLVLQVYGNKLEGHIPASLGALGRLSILNLAHNQFIGVIPSSLTNCSNLKYMYLAQNLLGGPIRADLGKLQSLTELKLFRNNLTGPIPSSLANCSLLSILDLSFNPGITGSVPRSIGQFASLSVLALQGLIGLTGGLPQEVGNLTSLLALSVYDSSLSNTIPSSIGNLGLLQDLELEGNSFTGAIPHEIFNCTNLALMSLGRNFLTGDIPESLCQHLDLHLQILYLNNNSLTGHIPSSLSDCSSLLDLDLSSNELTGSIPPSLGNLQSIWNNLAVSHNRLTGAIPAELGRLANVQFMSLAANNLSGNIPPALGGCLSLLVLDLSRNHLNGSVSDNMFDNLRTLEQLSLASNDLSGSIPPSLANLSSLVYLNLSDNRLQGEVPHAGVFLNSTAVHLSGNPGLCGNVVHVACKAHSVNVSTSAHPSPGMYGSHQRKVAIICSVGAALVLLAVSVSGWFWWVYSWRLPKRRSSGHVSLAVELGDQFMKLSANDLRIATDGYSVNNVLGSGNLSTVYEGYLVESGKTVAVKVLDLEGGEEAEQLFLAECRALCQIRHRNIVKVLSACSNLDLKAIVLEYMPQGSLEKKLQLHASSEGILRWEERLTIALDVALGLEYLHHDCPQAVIHSDVKPSNILLTDDLVAKVADFGIAKLVIKMGADFASVSRFRGSIGYAAPEYASSSRVTMQGDVYSYGVLVLEMVTGKSPTSCSFPQGVSLVTWAQQHIVVNNIEVLLDEGLLVECNGQIREIAGLLQLALLCASLHPKDRPTMRHAVALLRKLKAR